ncbi:hypothetical protein GCM10028805_48970 [Spirosoma harenae]
MRTASINRTRKVKILNQFLCGEADLLRQLKGPPPRKQAFTTEQLQAMTDEQLEVIIKLGKNQSCPDYGTMTNEQLDEIIIMGQTNEIQQS